MDYNKLDLDVENLIYNLDGMYIYEDMVMCKLFPKNVLDGVWKFAFDKSDVVVSTYPRSGEYWIICVMDCILRVLLNNI